MAQALRKPRMQPGYDGKRHLEPATVDDVYQKGKTESVVRNKKESTLSELDNIDDAERMAGIWFRRVYERMRMGSMAVDPSREPVDTSGIADPIPDRMIAASEQLRSVRELLGFDGYRMVELVCGQGWSIREAAWNKSRWEVACYGWLLRRSLNRLAEWLGYASKTRETN